MNKPNILYYECLNYNSENLKVLKNLFNVTTLPDPRYDSQLPWEQKNKIDCIFLPLGFTYGPHQIEQYPKCQIIASNTTTAPLVKQDEDSNILLLYLEDKSFLDCITSTAEHALGLMHAVHRRIPSALSHVKQGSWNRYDHGAPFMLSKAICTIWGYGRIGEHLWNRTEHLFMKRNVIGKNTLEEQINEVLERTDVLFLTLSVDGPQPVVTKHHLEQLPATSIVVNVSRGEVLDTQTLFRMLFDGELWGAGLDVLPRDHAFQYNETSDEWEWAKDYMTDHTNLIITPHIAGSTEDAWRDTQAYIIDKVKEILL